MPQVEGEVLQANKLELNLVSRSPARDDRQLAQPRRAVTDGATSASRFMAPWQTRLGARNRPAIPVTSAETATSHLRLRLRGQVRTPEAGVVSVSRRRVHRVVGVKRRRARTTQLRAGDHATRPHRNRAGRNPLMTAADRAALEAPATMLLPSTIHLATTHRAITHPTTTPVRDRGAATMVAGVRR
jgi:hypothetical protein